MWYSASIFMRSESPDIGDNEMLWEDSIVLLEAFSEEEALAKAEAHGKSAEHSYYSAENKLIKWLFVRVERVCQIGEDLVAGKELFSRFLRASEATSLLTPFDDK